MAAVFNDNANNNLVADVTDPTFNFAEYYLLDGNDSLRIKYEWAKYIEAGTGDDRVEYYGTGEFFGGPASLFIAGGAGNDTLITGAGNDSLDGGSGNDVMVSGLGSDNLRGGLGDDHYYQVNPGDTVLEHAGEGQDAVFTEFTHSLSVNIEDLVLLGSANINGTGNKSGNGIAGNDGRNVLMGLGGGDNLNGGYGKDTLFGGSGDDFFSFHLMGSENADRIKDFKKSDDTILLERSVFTNIAAADWLALKGGQFRAHSSGQAGDKSDRILYDTDNGKLYWDVDGKGGVERVHFATLDKHPSLGAADFLIV